ALTLFPSMGAPGIATASAVSGWTNAALLFGTLMWRGHWGSDRPLLLRLPRILASAAAMAGFLWFAADWLSAWLTHDALFATQAMALGMLVLGAMTIYFGLAFASGGADIGMLRRNVRRG
ncbi:MAG: lipid II flippase MurJ, partial [Mesorhizobium sp.]|nr:lipid II flippase MurJ [Mesorhizobium sp.]